MACQSNEIITIQCGHYANFIGSHWWNIQQSSFCFDPKVLLDDNCSNHDVLFREGRTLVGDFTYTPRLISFDLKERMGTLKKEGILYDLANQPTNIPWQEQLVIEQSKKAESNAFLKGIAAEEGICDVETKPDEANDTENVQMDASGDANIKRMKYDLDECVNVWSDFLKVHYHPKTMCLIDNTVPDLGEDDDEKAADSILLGMGLCNHSLMDEMEDKVHFFSEECDHLQAFQLFTDPYDRFAGVSLKMLEMLADDYGTKSLPCFAFIPTNHKLDTHVAHTHRLLSSLIAYTSIHEHSSLLVPLSCCETPWTKPQTAIQVPYLDYKTNLNYHTSAVLAAVLDTATMPLRSKVDPIHVRDLCSSLSYGGRKIASVIGSLPLGLSRDRPMVDHLMSLDGLPWRSFSALGQKALTLDAQIQQVVVRGVTGSLMMKNDTKDLPRMLSNVENAGQLLSLFLNESTPRTKTYARSFNPPVNTMDPFPHIFNSEIAVDGTLGSQPRNLNLGVESVAAIGGLQSHPAMGEHLRNLVKETKTINLRRTAGFFDQTFETDDFNECIERMLTIIDDYPSDETEESDSDNDDA